MTPGYKVSSKNEVTHIIVSKPTTGRIIALIRHSKMKDLRSGTIYTIKVSNTKETPKVEKVLSKDYLDLANELKKFNYLEHGKLPSSNEKILTSNVVDLASDGSIGYNEIAKVHHAQALYKNLKLMPTTIKVDRKAVWIFGESNCGKTSYITNTYGGAFDKSHDNIWTGYNQQEVIFIDNLMPYSFTNCKTLCFLLIKWAEKYNFLVNGTGGQFYPSYHTIFVTSIHPPSYYIQDKDLHTQLINKYSINEMKSDRKLYSFDDVLKVESKKKEARSRNSNLIEPAEEVDEEEGRIIERSRHNSEN